MKELDPQHLFYDSPYPVKLDDGEYIFRTDHDIVYAVSFKPEPFFDPIPAYWFDLTNRSDMAMRNRLFLRWFTGAEQSKQFFFKSEMVIDEGMENFIAIIVPRSHPYLDDIIKHFDSEIAMFRANKPQ